MLGKRGRQTMFRGVDAKILPNRVLEALVNPNIRERHKQMVEVVTDVKPAKLPPLARGLCCSTADAEPGYGGARVVKCSLTTNQWRRISSGA